MALGEVRGWLGFRFALASPCTDCREPEIPARSKDRASSGAGPRVLALPLRITFARVRPVLLRRAAARPPRSHQHGDRMDSRVWRTYVAVACRQAWSLDIHAGEELMRCVDALLAAEPLKDSVAVRVLLGTGVGEISVDRRETSVRIGVRLLREREGASRGGISRVEAILPRVSGAMPARVRP